MTTTKGKVYDEHHWAQKNKPVLKAQVKSVVLTCPHCGEDMDWTASAYFSNLRQLHECNKCDGHYILSRECVTEPTNIEPKEYMEG